MSRANIRYWLEWRPLILGESPKTELTKLTKPTLEGSKTVPAPTEAELDAIDRAMELLNNRGARILPGPVLGIPEGRITPEIRAAILTLGMGDLPLVSLAGEVAA
ncbi:MAG: hypothetical protein FJW36_23905 [Acidobacteria bacterium]|nr:hypothetical protein [Acidobacteriota bacterium]